jgi:hypothetical protein
MRYFVLVVSLVASFVLSWTAGVAVGKAVDSGVVGFIAGFISLMVLLRITTWLFVLMSAAGMRSPTDVAAAAHMARSSPTEPPLWRELLLKKSPAPATEADLI